jgi:hypothetical protein
MVSCMGIAFSNCQQIESEPSADILGFYPTNAILS